jgi:hypothetical protein
MTSSAEYPVRLKKDSLARTIGRSGWRASVTTIGIRVRSKANAASSLRSAIPCADAAEGRSPWMFEASTSDKSVPHIDRQTERR